MHTLVRTFALGCAVSGVLALAFTQGCRSELGRPITGEAGGDQGDTPSVQPGDHEITTAGDEGSVHDPTLTSQEQSLVDMPADSWMTVSEGYAAQCDDTFELEWHAVGGCSAVISAWSSGVWAAEPRLFLIWGGGHNDYAGNEVYGFSTRDFAWTQITTPSLGPYNRDPLDDGQPVSRHTYDGLAWINHLGKMFAWGGSRSNDGVGTKVTWLFEPLTATWEQVSTTLVPAGAYENSAVYDSVTKTIFLKVTQNVYSYNTDSGQYSLLDDLGFPPLWPRYAGGNATGALDTTRRLIWVVGTQRYLVYDLDRAEYVTDDWVTTGGAAFDNSGSVGDRPDQQIQTGGGEVITAPAPGLAYDSKGDQLLAWVGGGPWILNLSNKQWSRGNAQGAPTSPTGSGTYGRWRYLPRYNVFMLVTSTNAVHFYKNVGGGL